MRVLLEPELAAMATTTVTDETLARLRDGLDRMAGLEDDPDARRCGRTCSATRRSSPRSARR
jgi:DNA-binding FadR family transcriptional regulator